MVLGACRSFVTSTNVEENSSRYFICGQHSQQYIFPQAPFWFFSTDTFPTEKTSWSFLAFNHIPEHSWYYNSISTLAIYNHMFAATPTRHSFEIPEREHSIVLSTSTPHAHHVFNYRNLSRPIRILYSVRASYSLGYLTISTSSSSFVSFRRTVSMVFCCFTTTTCNQTSFSCSIQTSSPVGILFDCIRREETDLCNPSPLENGMSALGGMAMTPSCTLLPLFSLVLHLMYRR